MLHPETRKRLRVILKVAGVVGHEDITALVQKDKRAPLAMASADVPLRSPVPMTAAPEPKAGTLERKPRLGNVNGP